MESFSLGNQTKSSREHGEEELLKPVIRLITGQYLHHVICSMYCIGLEKQILTLNTLRQGYTYIIYFIIFIFIHTKYNVSIFLYVYGGLASSSHERIHYRLSNFLYIEL